MSRDFDFNDNLRIFFKMFKRGDERESAIEMFDGLPIEDKLSIIFVLLLDKQEKD